MPEETLLALAEGDGHRRRCSPPTAATTSRCSPSSTAAGVDLDDARRAAAGRRAPRSSRSRGRTCSSASPARRAQSGRPAEVASLGPAGAAGMKSLPGWERLVANHAAVGDRHLRELFAADPGRGERLVAEAEGLRARLLQEPGRRRDDRACSSRSPAMPGSASGPRRCSRGERINVDRGPLRPPRRAADAARALADRRRPRRRRRRPRGARPDGGVQRPDPQRRVDRAHGQADPQRRQHRHRRLRPRPGDGLPGAAPLRRPRADGPLRLQRRCDRLRREDPRPRPGRDAVRRRLEDVHDAGDDDQRPQRPASGRWRPSATRPPSPSTSSPSRPTPRRSPPSGSTPTTCSASGTGSAAATRWTRRSG